MAKGVYLKPADSRLYDGIDVSEWQGNIDFDEVRKAGIDTVYIRSSEGNDYVDPYFERNYEKAKRAGLRIGFYHYVTARSASQAEYQAHFFVSLIRGKEFEGKIAMDFEDLTDLTNREINTIAKAFIKEVERLSKKKAVIYSDASNAENTFDEELTAYPLWIAQYGVSEPSDAVRWSEWAGWQYSDSGRVSGISGDVDRDHFTRDMYLNDKSAITKPANRSSKTTIVTYTIKPGDTLTKIAKLYHTTVQAIIRENGIKNPNEIYAGEKLKIVIKDDKQTRTLHQFLYTVKAGDTLTSIAKRYGIKVEQIVKWNDLENPDLLHPGEKLRIRTS